MSGLEMMLKSMGIKIDIKEIEAAWERSKDALPQLAKAFDEISATQKRIESKVDSLIAWRDGIESKTSDDVILHQKPNGSLN